MTIQGRSTQSYAQRKPVVLVIDMQEAFMQDKAWADRYNKLRNQEDVIERAVHVKAPVIFMEYRIIVKDEKGKTLLEIPATVGVIGTVLAPWLTALGVIAALVTNCRIVVERRE